jgi:hypothetical protein
VWLAGTFSPERAMADMRLQSSAAGTGQAPDALVARLRQVLTTHSGPSTDDGQLSAGLRAIATDAQAHGIRAEQLLTLLKGAFDGLDTRSTLVSAQDRDRRLSYIVTACVREYYAVYPGSRPDGTGDTS